MNAIHAISAAAFGGAIVMAVVSLGLSKRCAPVLSGTEESRMATHVVLVSRTTPSNGTISAEFFLTEREDLVSGMERTSASAIYPDAIWDKSFRADRPEEFESILNGFEGRGALVPIVLIAIDENGSPIQGASVRLSFSSPDGIDKPVVRSGTTDATGRFAAEERSVWSVGWIVEKDGFYSYRSNMVLRPYASLQGWEARRWFRSPFPVIALLREKRTPHEMVFHNVRLPLPPPGETVGFDCLEGTPTPPHGTGKHVDIEFSTVFDSDEWKPRSVQDRESVVRISFPGNGNGGMVMPVDESSELHTPRLSPDDGYSDMLESTILVADGKYSKRKMIQPDQYILFRIRSEVLSDGSTTNGLFGKTRGDWYVNGPKRLLCFRIWTNEEVGNRNLEDTSGWW
jgi:hypothetical protein